MKNDKNLNTFAQRLKERRKVLGLTQEALVVKANEVGKTMGVTIGKSQIGRYELLKDDDTKGFPVFSTGICLAKALNCSLDWLYGHSDIDIFNSEYSETESVEVTLLKILRAMLEEAITDWCIDDTEVDKKSILINNSVFEEFISEYQETNELEDTIIEKFGEGSSHLDIVAGRKEEIWVKYVQKFAEMEKDCL